MLGFARLCLRRVDAFLAVGGRRPVERSLLTLSGGGPFGPWRGLFGFVLVGERERDRRFLVCSGQSQQCDTPVTR